LFDVVSSSRQAFGQVVHAALSEMEQRGERMPDVVGLLDAHWSSTEGRFGTRLRAAAFREMAADALRQVAQVDQERRNDGLQFVAAEARFNWCIAPGVELRGTIDRIDRGPAGLSVVDYKLGAESPSINKLLDMFAAPTEPEKLATWRPSDLQLPLYALAIEHGTVEGYPELPVNVSMRLGWCTRCSCMALTANHPRLDDVCLRFVTTMPIVRCAQRRVAARLPLVRCVVHS
jgi:hypothetical protein